MLKARQAQGRLILASIAAITVGGLLAACISRKADLEEQTRPSNVILISIDTLRADHLGCYGYDRDTSPALDALSEEAVVFEETIAQAPSTLHSHASMFTSLLPHHHQATWAGKTRIPEAAVTLAEVFLQAGYRTAAFTGGGQMDRIFGLDQGFELFEQPSAERFEGTVWKGVQWIGSDDSRPFFLFLHSYEVHHPYTPRAEYLALFESSYSGALPSDISLEVLGQINRGEIPFDEDQDLRHVIAAYDAEIRSADVGLANLIDYLWKEGLYDDTLIVFTSDHGEEFGEHGQVGVHSHTLFDELLKVPLVIKLPGSTHGGRRVGQQVRGIDVAPTIVSVVGLEVPQEFAGSDITSLLADGERDELIAISRLDLPPGLPGTTSVRTKRWKLIEGELMDLLKDPAEQWYANPTSDGAAAAKRLKGALEQGLASREPYPPEVVAPPDVTIDELRALGYVQ